MLSIYFKRWNVSKHFYNISKPCSKICDFLKLNLLTYIYYLCICQHNIIVSISLGTSGVSYKRVYIWWWIVTFTQVLYLKSSYLYFTWVFPFYVILHSYLTAVHLFDSYYSNWLLWISRFYFQIHNVKIWCLNIDYNLIVYKVCNISLTSTSFNIKCCIHGNAFIITINHYQYGVLCYWESS